MSDVVVVGGGITGLAAARDLADAGLAVTVLESSDRWGGKVASALVDGVRLDVGAESVLARRPEAVSLIDDLGLGPDRVHPTGAKPALLVGGRLRALPPSVLGVPTDLDQLRPLLSESGYQQALRSASLDAPLVEDVAIGAVVDERFGPEVTDRLLEPLLGGVYAGRARELSFDAVAHDLFTRARGGGSLLDVARATARPGDGSPVFAGLGGGVSMIIDRLLADLHERGVELCLEQTVRAIVRLPDGRFEVEIQRGAARETTTTTAVLLTTPARPTGRLVSGLVAVGTTWAEIPYASVAVVTLVVRNLETAASGVLVPPGELPTIKALTHSSLKWDWVADRAARTWGAGAAVVRASVGRLGEEALLQLPDAQLLARTWAEASGLPGWSDTVLLASAVTRWGGALPQYRVGHRDLVATLRDQVAAVRGLAVAGAALDGVGIAACLGSARRAVTKIMNDLEVGRGGMEVPEPVEESRT